METVNILGTLAGTLTTVAFVPQVLKTWRSRSATDISTGMFLIFTLGVLMWLVYGLFIHSWPIIIANAITLVLASAILAMKVYFHR